MVFQLFIDCSELFLYAKIFLPEVYGHRERGYGHVHFCL